PGRRSAGARLVPLGDRGPEFEPQRVALLPERRDLLLQTCDGLLRRGVGGGRLACPGLLDQEGVLAPLAHDRAPDVLATDVQLVSALRARDLDVIRHDRRCSARGGRRPCRRFVQDRISQTYRAVGGEANRNGRGAPGTCAGPDGGSGAGGRAWKRVGG